MRNWLKTRNWIYLIVMTVVRGGFMPFALIVSFGHIISAGERLGLTGWQAWTAPLFIDGFAILGMVGRGHAFAADTRRWALWMQIGAGAASLVANIYAGTNAGERIYGFLVVVGFGIAERFAERAYAAPPAPVEPTAEELAAAMRSDRSRKAAATRKANQAAAKAAAAKQASKGKGRSKARPASTVDELEALLAAAAAPVSPAPIGA